MTAADLCSSFKQWEVQRSNVSIIMEEFFQQVIQMIQHLVIMRALSLSLLLFFWRKIKKFRVLFCSSSEDVQTLLMTSVDLCAMSKPWDVQRSVVNILMDEFWQQV